MRAVGPEQIPLLVPADAGVLRVNPDCMPVPTPILNGYVESGDYVGIAEHTQHIYRALTYLGVVSRNHALVGSMHSPERRRAISEQYGNDPTQLAAALKGAGERAARVSRKIKPAFLRGYLGDDAHTERAAEQTTLRDWRTFCAGFEGGRHAQERDTYRGRLERLAKVYNIALNHDEDEFTIDHVA